MSSRSLVALLSLLALLAAACSGADGAGGDASGGADGRTGDGVDGPGGADGDRSPDAAGFDAYEEPPFHVRQVLPAKGSAYGGDLVAVVGRGFVPEVRVWFGGGEARNVTVIGEGYLEITTPPGTVGPADVRVDWPDDTTSVLEDGFFYEQPIRVLSLSPAEGPTDGGTPLVLTGEGFTAAAQVVIGGRLALQVRVADAHTIVALSPPAAAAGPADVHVGGEYGSGVLRGGFTYRDKARISAVTPPFGPADGGSAVAIEGAGLAAAEATAFFGAGRATRVGAPAAPETPDENDGERLDVLTPPGPVGPVDVAVTTPWNTALAPGGFVFTAADAAQQPLALLGVAPGEGSTDGGERVTLVAHGLRGVGPGAVSVTIGGRSAPVLGVGASDVRVETPAGDAGAADVRLTVSGEAVTLADGFTYRAPLVVTAVAPVTGPPEGGTALTVRGAGFAGGVDEVRVGALAATGVRVVGDGELAAVAPPGTAGRVDVVVRRGDREARLPLAFEYRASRPRLVAIDPTSGSVSGGTNVHLYGSGLSDEPTVTFGTWPARILETVDDGHLVVSAPAHPQGTVDVAVARGAQRVVLPGAFTYFAPESGNGGTWGAPVQGVVNVSVVDVFTEAGVPEAFVTLGDPATSPYSGTTDAEGRITFSGPDLSGAQEVSAAHPDYSAASVIAFDAENVTLLLFPHFPPNVAPPPDFANLGPGTISGRVLWDDKYKLIPYGDCALREPEGALCLPCGADDDCGEGAVCTRIGQTGRYCTTSCSALGEGGVLGPDAAACPGTYSCSHMGANGYQCVPVPGDVLVRCETTRPYPNGSVPAPGAGALVGPDMTYSITARLDELAVVCVAAQQKVLFGEPEPFLMGVRRRLQVETQTELTGQDVVLDIPLRSTLRVRLDQAPEHPIGDDVWMVTPYLDFGAEGTWRLGSPTYGVRGQDRYEVPRLPEGLTGPLTGASYALSVTQFSRFASDSHFGHAWSWGISDVDQDSLLRWDGETWQVEEVGAAMDAHGLAADAAGRLFAVGEVGRVARREGGVWFVEAVPVKATLFAVHAEGGAAGDGGAAWAAGQDGTLLRRGATGWRVVDAAPTVDLYALAGAPGAAPLVAGDRGVAGRIEDGLFVPLDSGTDRPLHAALVAGPDDLWLGGADGVVVRVDAGAPERLDLPEPRTVRVLVATPDGAVLALTDGGGAWRRDGAAWQAEDTTTFADLHAAAALPDGALLAVGDAGTVVRRDAAGAWALANRPGYHADLRAVAVTPDGAAFAAGLHGLLVAPILGVPQIDTVRRRAEGGLRLEWHVPEGALPTIQYIAIVSNAGYPMWDVFLEPAVTALELPDFDELADFDPLAGGTLYLTLRRIYHPSLDIDRFSFWDVWFGEFWPAVSETTVPLE